MRKLRLELDSIKVDTFSVGESGALRGTVKGHATEVQACTQYCNSEGGSCAIETCNYSACWGLGETCGCALSNIGSCYNQPTCANGVCLGHTAGWCTPYGCSVGGVTCNDNCGGTELQTVGCDGY